tara:strand:- start:698 stop:1021 length:324 start_codon:yes stop_codon:yes gene_type:complete
MNKKKPYIDTSKATFVVHDRTTEVGRAKYADFNLRRPKQATASQLERIEELRNEWPGHTEFTGEPYVEEAGHILFEVWDEDVNEVGDWEPANGNTLRIHPDGSLTRF